MTIFWHITCVLVRLKCNKDISLELFVSVPMLDAFLLATAQAEYLLGAFCFSLDSINLDALIGGHILFVRGGPRPQPRPVVGSYC